MKNDYSYGWEKLHNAMYCLIGSGDQRDRLASAVSTVSVLIIRPEEQYLPEEIQTEVTKFMKEMTSLEATGNEGTIRATVNSLDEMALNRAVEKLLHFYDTVCRYQEPF